MSAPDAVLDLVERFARNREQYLNPAYNETQARREFIDPQHSCSGPVSSSRLPRNASPSREEGVTAVPRQDHCRPETVAASARHFAPPLSTRARKASRTLR